jgi:hypothetical protein
VRANNERLKERRLAARQKTCAMCRGPMEAKRSSKHYCSPKCRQKAVRKGWTPWSDW